MRRLVILHVEDNREDALLLVRACEVAGLPAEFHDVTDGAEAMAYLAGEGSYADRTVNPLPDLVILDLRMPGVSGLEFLRWVREGGFKRLPVLVFTISRNEEDREQALAAGATAFYAKPLGFDALVRLAETFAQATRPPAN